MARNFKELQEKLYAKMTPEQRAEHEARLAKDIAKVRLNQLRQARELTQAALAAKLGTDQGSISRLEQQADFYISTLRNYIEGTGGHLEMLAVYPDHTVSLDVTPRD
jgi:DNA-binding XRE family transcriptional regulator